MRWLGCTVIAAALTVCVAGEARATMVLRIEPHSFLVGEVTTLRYHIDGDWSAHTECDSFLVRTSGSIDWGDGWGDGWDPDSGWHGPPHAYARSGFYVIRMHVWWQIWSYGHWTGNPECPITGGSMSAEIVAEVQGTADDIESGWLGTAFDVTGSVCGQPGPASRVYVVAGLAGRSSVGVAGAEFRVQAPSNYMINAVPMPGWVMVGNPTGDGATLAAACAATPVSNRVPILAIDLLAMPGARLDAVRVEPHRVPSNANYNGLILILCDAPGFTALTVGPGPVAIVSPGEAATLQCPDSAVGVQSSTWGGVKSMYRLR